MAIRTAVDCGSEVSGQEVGNEDQSLIIRSDMPVQYWSGTVVIARLGSHASGVFVTITDIGRRVLIEARDFENGPLLALSRASLEVWTGENADQRYECARPQCQSGAYIYPSHPCAYQQGLRTS